MKKAIKKNNKIKVTFSFDKIILQKVRTLLGKKWHSGNKYWTCFICLENINNLIKWGFDVDSELMYLLKQDALKNLKIKIYIKNTLIIKNPTLSFKKEIIDLFTVKNPKFESNKRNGYSNYKTPRYFYLAEYINESLIIKRGCYFELLHYLEDFEIEYTKKYLTKKAGKCDFKFHGKLRPEQKLAVKDFDDFNDGFLEASTGAGKTVMALNLIAKRNVPTLIIVHTIELIEQWKERINTFLKIPIKDIGQLGGTKKELKEITITTIQTLYKMSDSIANMFGHVVVDEAHKVPSRTFQEALNPFYSKYLLGLTATPYRADKLEKLMFASLGPIIHTIDTNLLKKNKSVLNPQIIIKETNFQLHSISTKINNKGKEVFEYPKQNDYTTIMNQISEDTNRNIMICQDIEQFMGKGMSIVICDRKKQCYILFTILYEAGIYSEVLEGSLNKKKREKITKKLNNNEVPVLIATGKLIGEGYDCKHLTNIFLASPIKYKGKLIQYIGRVLRPEKNKTPHVIDYVDYNISLLEKHALIRQNVYKKQYDWKGE